MAKAVRQEVVTIDLQMSVEEAIFLKGLVQNYLGTDEESSTHSVHREAIFTALDNAIPVKLYR